MTVALGSNIGTSSGGSDPSMEEVNRTIQDITNQYKAQQAQQQISTQQGQAQQTTQVSTVENSHSYTVPTGYSVGIAITIGLACLIVYFLPAIVAKKRMHNNRLAIFIMNLFVGWTFLGWVVALIWASTKDTEYNSFRGQGNVGN